MTSRSRTQIADAGDLAARMAQSGHHYHGLGRIVLAAVAFLVVAGVILLVVRSRRRAGPRPPQQRLATALRPVAPPSRPRVVAGAVCWLLGLQWFAGQAIAQAAWTTPYSLSRNYISDLGVTRCGTYQLRGETSYICSPLHEVMNASFVLGGLLLVAGVVLLRGIWPRRPLATAGLVLLALDGIGHIGAGLAPGNVNMTLHSLASFGILCGGIGALLLGSAVWRATRWQAAGFLAVGAAGTAGFLAMAAAPAAHLPVGTFERIAGWPLPAWLAALGLTLIVSRTTTEHLAGRRQEKQATTQPAP